MCPLPAGRASREPLEVLEDVGPIRAAAFGDDVFQKTPIEGDVVVVRPQVDIFIDEPAAHERTDMVVDVAEVCLRMDAPVDRDLVQAAAETLILHALGEIVTHEVDELAYGRVLERLKRAEQTGELIRSTDVVELDERDDRGREDDEERADCSSDVPRLERHRWASSSSST